MIREDNLKIFQEFVYNIEGITLPKKDNGHFSIVGNIDYTLVIVKRNNQKWKINNVKIGDESYDFTNFNSHATLEKHLRGTEPLKLKSLYSFMLYFFFVTKSKFGDVAIAKGDVTGFFIEEMKKLKKALSVIESEKGYGEIEGLINHILKNVFNTEFQIKIDEKWNLEIINNGEIALNFKKEENNLLNFSKQEILEKVIDIKVLKQYCSTIVENHKIIKLTSVGFEMPIENFIEIPLNEINLELLQEYKTLSADLETMEGSNQKQNSELYEKKSIRLNKIKNIIHKNHDLLDKINLNQDIFIQAKAGTGKSTLLRWLAYNYSLNFIDGKKNRLPVFIELKDHFEDSLSSFIKLSLNKYDIKDEIINSKTLLLIDGFDEFNGDTDKLIRDISYLKTKYKLQIIFTGRTKPSFVNYDLAIKEYSLRDFNSDNIKFLFTSYFGDEKGKEYYSIFSMNNFGNQIYNPLFLTFVLSYFNNPTNIKSNEEITSLIYNNGKLFHSVLLNSFLNKHEKNKRQTNAEEWENLKKNEIKFISFLAYKMTFDLKKESIEKQIAESIVLNFSKSIIDDYFKDEDNQIINVYIKHNFLNLFNNRISFEKKELRLFFSALYLSTNIATYKQYRQYELKLINDSGIEIWKEVESYLIGLINADNFVDPNQLIFNNGRLVLNKQSFHKFKLLIKFVHNKNYPTQNGNIVDEKFIIQKLNIIIHDYYIIMRFEKMYKSFLIYYILLGFIYKMNPERISLSSLKYLNFTFICNNVENSLLSIQRFLYSYNLNLSFFDYMKMINSLDNVCLGEIMTDFLKKKIPLINPTKEELFNFTFEFIFNNQSEYKNLFENSCSDHLMREFFRKKMAKHLGEFLEYIYQKKPNPSLYNYMKIAKFSRAFIISSQSNYFTNINPVVSSKIEEAIIIGYTKFLKRTFLLNFMLKFVITNVNEELKEIILKKLSQISLDKDTPSNIGLNAKNAIKKIELNNM